MGLIKKEFFKYLDVVLYDYMYKFKYNYEFFFYGKEGIEIFQNVNFKDVVDEIVFLLLQVISKGDFKVFLEFFLEYGKFVDFQIFFLC